MQDLKIERRSFPVGEFRAGDDPESRIVSGHAAVFDTLSVEMGGFRERVAQGAFANTIKNDDVRGLWNHDPASILARTKSGTLKLSEDDRGLAFSMDVAETRVGNDLLVSIRRGDVDEMSFGFVMLDEAWEQEAGQELATRTLKQVRLLDVSPVSFPAYPGTDVNVAVRSLAAWRATQNVIDPIAAASRDRTLQIAEAD